MRKAKLIILLFTMMLLVSNTHGLIIGNESCQGFGGGGKSENPCDSGSEKSSPTIGQYLVEGGGYYLNSYSDVMILLNRVEMSVISGVNYEELQGILNSAIDHLEHAKSSYLNLCNLAEITPYNQDIIVLLMNFDYAAFKKDYGLNTDIFRKVEELLNKGDIRGVYNHLYGDVCNILVQLYNLKENVDNDSFPKIADLWRINQNFSQSILFGQYVAEVFYKIK